MPLSHHRPSLEYMRELKAVARTADGLRAHLPKLNLLPDGFPFEQVEAFCNALVRLPDGTAEGSIAPLRAADSELNRIRQRFIPAHDEEAGDAEPLVPRDSDFDLRLVGLMAAVRAAIERYKFEAGEELDTDVTPDRPPNPDVELAKPGAFADIAAAARDIDAAEIALDAADPSESANLDAEKRLLVSADVGVGSANAALSTEAPRATVLGWLDDTINGVATEMERIAELTGPKAKGVGKELGGLTGELAEIWFPKVAKSLRVVGARLSKIRTIITGAQDCDPTPPPPDFNYAEVYERLLSGQPVPAAWAPHVAELDFNFAEPHHLSTATINQFYEMAFECSTIDLLGNLTNLEHLDLSATQAVDIDPLQNLFDLKYLDLAGTLVNDIRPLANLINLQTLSLTNTQVADIRPLLKLANLQHLDLSNTRVADIKPLEKLTKLLVLNLADTLLSDIVPLGKLTSLKELQLGFTGVADIRPLENLSNLLDLNMAYTPVSDIRPIEKLAQLENLKLMVTGVTNIAPLQNLANLKFLDLRGTQVTDTSPLAHLVEAGLTIIGP